MTTVTICVSRFRLVLQAYERMPIITRRIDAISLEEFSARSPAFQSRKTLSSEAVRGTLLTQESDSSFAEAHRVLLSEPTDIESEDEDQEDEV